MTSAGITTGIHGDPITSYLGKRTQFWGVPGKPINLLHCGVWGVRASVFNGPSENQWFKDFQIVLKGRVLANVTMPATIAQIKPASVPGSDEAETHASYEGAAAQREVPQPAAARPGPRTISVSAAGWGRGWEISGVGESAVLDEGIRGVGEGEKFRAQVVASNHAGYHTAHLQFGGMVLHVSSAPAMKMAAPADRVRYAHLDVNFRKLDEQHCTGVLPEIWGVQPMGRETAEMLVPPDTHTTRKKEQGN